MRARLAVLLVAVALTGAMVPAAADPAPVAFRCNGDGGVEAMENEYIDVLGAGACWAHLGHHTYDAGAVYEVGAVSGSLFTVEIQLSPPLEYADASADPVLVFEGSVDGLAWETLHAIRYPLLGGIRQGLTFSFDAGGARARFLRIRQPLSAAQGLSGYIDSSSFDAELTQVPADETPAAPQRQALSCATDVMERFFDAHPCWFGGINRYDAPSVFHTYPIAPTSLARVRGSATFLPWRSDDYTQNGGNRRTLTGVVQVSTDGVDWTDIATIAGDYGLPIAFDVTLSPAVDASFVRLVAERHKGYTAHAALKHVRGFLVDSAIEIHAAPA